ncbi:MAG: hypothetical protein ACREPX_11795 [Rhodanobacteraceae bacterium]
MGAAARAIREPEWLLGIGLGILFVAALVAMRHCGVFTDELDHYSQIVLFRRGEFRVYTDYLTTIPGYNLLVAAILWIFRAESLDAARLVNAAFALIGVAGFHSLRRHLWPGTQTLATAQLLVLPILVPLFFLVYTDMLALALLVWATFATLKQRHWISALLLTALIGVRQNGVVWAGFLAVMAAWPLWSGRGLQAWKSILARAIPYGVPVAAFVVFWAWNGSISLSHGQAAVHPDTTPHAGNLYFALFVAGVLLPLQSIAGLKDFAAHAKRHRWLFAIPLLLFAAFWFGFRADNPFNALFPHYYVRNAFLLAVDSEPALRALVGAVVVLGACGLAFTRLRPTYAVWLFPFAALFLSASWLIEQRYTMVPLVLWLAFREQRGRAIEWATLALWLALAVWLFRGMIAVRFFL